MLTTYSEPEFRLVFMALSAVGCSIGMFLFGYTMGHGSNAVLCAFFGGVQMFGVLIGIWSSFSYALDAFRNLSSEMFILNMVFKVIMCHEQAEGRDFFAIHANKRLARTLYTMCFLALQTTGSLPRDRSR